MATERRKTPAATKPQRHPLLVYRHLGYRYRPPALLLIVMGLFAFLPTFIGELHNEDIPPGTLAVVGLVLVLVGIAFWQFAALALRRAYVECLPDVVLIRTPFARVRLSYRRIKAVRAVPVAKVYERTKLRGMRKPLLKPLLKDMAVVVYVKSWPAPKRALRWRIGNLLFAPQEEGWVLIVPDCSALLRQVEVGQQRKYDEDRQAQTGYQDPIERLRHFKPGR